MKSKSPLIRMIKVGLSAAPVEAGLRVLGLGLVLSMLRLGLVLPMLRLGWGCWSWARCCPCWGWARGCWCWAQCWPCWGSFRCWPCWGWAECVEAGPGPAPVEACLSVWRPVQVLPLFRLGLVQVAMLGPVCWGLPLSCPVGWKEPYTYIATQEYRWWE